MAKDAGAPYAVLDKVRRGDREVEISVHNLGDIDGRTPVLVDDIIWSGRTMVEAVRSSAHEEGWPPICVAIHGLFADNSDALLAQTGARVVTSNGIAHPTNKSGASEILSGAISELALLPSRRKAGALKR